MIYKTIILEDGTEALMIAGGKSKSVPIRTVFRAKRETNKPRVTIVEINLSKTCPFCRRAYL